MSESTISQNEEENLGMQLDYVTMEAIVGFYTYEIE